MVALFSVFLACSTPPTQVSQDPPAVVAPAAAAPVAGTIGGEPILPKPVVIGGIDNADVEAGIVANLSAFYSCYEAHRGELSVGAGKVLLKFTIGKDGKVTKATTHASSLRNEPTETCLNEQVLKTTFPALRSGRAAIVLYPFVFPRP